MKGLFQERGDGKDTNENPILTVLMAIMIGGGDSEFTI